MKVSTYLALGLVAIGGAAVLIRGGYLDDIGRTTAAAQRAPGGERGGRAALVRVEKSERSTFTDTVQAVGSTRARRTVDVTSLVEGRIKTIAFAAGQQVDADAVLVTLDDRTQQATLREARSTQQEAQSAFERAKSLVERKIASEATLDQTRATLARARAAVERAEEDLQERTVTAPFAGMVGIAKVEVGERIDADTVITHLDDFSEIEVEFRVPEIYLTRVGAGQTVTAHSDAFGERPFEGTITAVDSRIDPASRAFTVRAVLANPDLALRTGMFMHVTLTLATRISVAVPEEAIVTESSETFVYLVDNGKAVRRQVTLGRRVNGSVEVLSGMDAGEKVISSGIQNVGDGRPVEVIDGTEADTPGQPRTG